MILTYVFASFVLVAVYLSTLLLPVSYRLPQLSQGSEFALWTSFAILLTLLFMRPAYSLWLSLDFWIAPWSPGA